MRALSVGASAVCFALFVACVGDDPVVSDPSKVDGGSAGDGSVDPGREGGSDATADGSEAGRDPAGKFVWALKAPRGPGTVTDGLVGIGAADKIGGTTSVSTSTSFGGKATTASGAAVFRADAAKSVAFASVIGLPAGGDTTILATATDSFGDVYVAGSFTASALTIGATTLQITGTGGSDFFAKLSGTDGSVLWARSLKPTGYSIARAITTHGTDVAVAFEFGGNGGAGAVTYDRKDGGTTTPVTVNAEAGSPDGLVLFLDSATGKALWAKQVHGPATDRIESIRIDASGNVFVGGGSFSATLKIDADTTAALVKGGDAGSAPPFVLRFDAADPHAVGFARSFGLATAGKSGTVRGLAAAANGDLLVCGSSDGSIDLGSGVLAGKGLLDGFVARLPKVGAPTWAQSFGGAQDDECTSIDTDPSDQVVIGLSYRSSGVTFDGHAFAAPFAGQPAGAVAKLAGTGKLLWGFDVVGHGASVRSVAVHPTGDVLYSGSYLGTVDLGDGATPSGNGGADPSFFLVRRTY